MNNKSSVCLIAKNEALYLIEWVAHYVALGFDEIIIYDDLSTDNTEALLENLNNCGLIKYIKWHGEDGESPQMSAYRHAAQTTKCQYIAFFDADEFLVLKDFSFVNNFLKQFDNKPNVAAIAFNWRMFGDNGRKKYESRLLRDRFNKCDKSGNPHLKSFTRLKCLEFVNNMHICDVNGLIVHPSGKEIKMSNFGLSDEIELTHGQVNHYFCKTYEEYVNKKSRGVADVIDGSNEKFSKYNDELFQAHNANQISDSSINWNRKVFDLVYDFANNIASGNTNGLLAKLKAKFIKNKIRKLCRKESLKQASNEG